MVAPGVTRHLDHLDTYNAKGTIMIDVELRRLVRKLEGNADSSVLLEPEMRIVVEKADLYALIDYVALIDRTELAVSGTIGAPDLDIVIAIADGMASAVRVPPGCNVEIRDYDCPEDFGELELEVDEHGDSYQSVDI